MKIALASCACSRRAPPVCCMMLSISAQRSSSAAGRSALTPSQTCTAVLPPALIPVLAALRPVSHRISLRAFMPWKNSTGKLNSVASGSPSRTSPLWVNEMFTVDCGLLSQRWPVVMCGMIWPTKLRALFRAVQFQQQVPGERKVVAAQHKSLYIGDVQFNHVPVLRVRPPEVACAPPPPRRPLARANALRIPPPAVPAHDGPYPGTAGKPPESRPRTFPGSFR